MNPLEQRVAALEAQLKALSSFNTIPFGVEKAFKKRLISNLQEQVEDITVDFPSPPFAQAVNEGGMSSYDVMTTPEYALKVRLGNLYVAIPAFDI